MAGNFKFSLNENACVDLEGFFSESINEATENVLKVFENLYDINSKTAYRIVMEKTIEFAENYSGDLQDKVRDIFNEWRDEGESIVKFAKDMSAAEDDEDESVEAAQKLEEALFDCICDAFRREPLYFAESTLVDLSEGKEKLFAEINDILNVFNGEMEDLIDKVDSASNDRGEENQLYVNIGGLLSSVLTAYKSFFEGFNEGMSTNLSEEVSDSNVSVMDTVESDTEKMKVTAENVGEYLKEVSSLFSK